MFKMIVNRRTFISIVKIMTLVNVTALTLIITPTVVAQLNFDKLGDPVHLMVGYQPYYTESWSGVINKEKQFWKQYLPAGSTVEFQVGLQGSVIVNAMAAKKQHIGYMGDMPAIASTFRYLKPRGGTDIRIVAVLGTSKQQCNIFLVRHDAPVFSNGTEAVQWLDGKVAASPHGACADRFAQLAFQKVGIKPKRYLNQNIGLITRNLAIGKLDAVTIWEPTASKLIKTGIARRAATGEDFDVLDGGFMVMLHDLIVQRPDIVKAWLQAELDAQLFMADPAHRDEVVNLIKQNTQDIEADILRNALYGGATSDNEIKMQLDFVVTERVRQLLDDATAFLHTLPRKPAAKPKLRDDAVLDTIARQILQERGLESPIGIIKAGNDG